MSHLLTVIALTASALGSAMAFPQARHLLRTRRIDGVSPTWAGVSVAINAWWIAYATVAELWLVLPVSIVSVVLYATIGVVLVRTGGRAAVPGLAVGALALGMVPLPFLLGGGWAVAGVAIGMSYGVQLLPAVVAVCRTRLLGGVAASTWLLAWSESALWLVYGVGVRDAAVIAAGAIGVAMSSIILARLAVTGHEPLRVVAQALTVVRRPAIAR